MKRIYFIVLLLSLVELKASAIPFIKEIQQHKIAKLSRHKKKPKHFAQQISLLRQEIEAMENSSTKENIEKITIWLETLEAQLLSKLKHAETRIEKYHNRISAATEETQSSRSLEKIHSSENKIETYQELLKTLDQLKAKLMKYNDSNGLIQLPRNQVKDK
jgi:hypothetical protein